MAYDPDLEPEQRLNRVLIPLDGERAMLALQALASSRRRRAEHDGAGAAGASRRGEGETASQEPRSSTLGA